MKPTRPWKRPRMVHDQMLASRSPTWMPRLLLPSKFDLILAFWTRSQSQVPAVLLPITPLLDRYSFANRID
jgi:hypothetical protein